MTGDAPTPMGRSSEAVSLSDYTVSRRHAEVVKKGGRWRIEDLKSANGTYVNGQRVERPTYLKHGDQVRIGGTVLMWSGTEEPPRDALRPTYPVAADMIELDSDDRIVDASIIGTVPSAEDSMILASPAAAEAVRAWRAMSTLLEAVGTGMGPNDLVVRVLDVVFEEVPVDHAFILMQEAGTGEYKAEFVRHRVPSQERIRTSRTIVDHVIQDKQGILCSNAMSDERFGPSHRGGSIAAMGLQSVICVPIIARDEVLGVIHLDCAIERHIYSEEQLRLVAAIGRMAGLALENARLVAERVRTERLTATGETVAALSHHIKNILQGMMSGSDIVEMGLRQQGLPLVDQGWQIVRRNLDKITSLTMNMLAFAKKREPRIEDVQFNTLVEEAVEMLQRRAEDKGVVLLAELGDQVPAVPMDPDGMHQVVLNIIGNAIDAVPKSTGAVKARTAYDARRNEVLLTVGDNGPGIDEEVLSKVFDPFYSTKGQGGTGLGLAVTKKIVEEHFGRISVESVVGQGTIVRVILPATRSRAEDSSATHGPALDSAATHGPAQGRGGRPDS